METISNKSVLIKDIIRTLPLDIKFPWVTSVIILAPPGAGQNLLAEKFSHDLGLVHLRLGSIQHYLAPKAGFFDNLEHVEQFTIDLIVELAKGGYSCILEGNINKRSDRELLRKRLRRLKATLSEVVIDCTEKQIRDQVIKENNEIQLGERSGHILDSQFMEYRRSKLEPPVGEERFSINCGFVEVDLIRLREFLKIKLGFNDGQS